MAEESKGAFVQASVSWTMTPKGAKALRARANGFTAGKQRRFFKALRKTGCVRDACRRAGISSETAYRTRRRLPEFAKKWELALKIAAGDLEMLAWERATVGAEVVTMRGGEVVSVTRKPSDAILRLLMQGANPAKYGRTAPAPARKQAQVPEPAPEPPRERTMADWDEDEVAAEIERRLDLIEARNRGEDMCLDWLDCDPPTPEEQAVLDKNIRHFEEMLHLHER